MSSPRRRGSPGAGGVGGQNYRTCRPIAAQCLDVHVVILDPGETAGGSTRHEATAQVSKGQLRTGQSASKAAKPPTAARRGPPWLRGEGLWMWRQLTQLLSPQAMAALTRADWYALMMLCEAYREYRQALATVEAEGRFLVVRISSGTARLLHPAVRIASDARRRVCAMLAEFGLTPAARAKVSSGERPARGPLAELLARRPGRPGATRTPARRTAAPLPGAAGASASARSARLPARNLVSKDISRGRTAAGKDGAA